MFKYIALLIFSTALIACSSTTSSKKAPGRDRNMISEEEIAGIDAMDAYDLIRMLRPYWLRGRGAKSFLNVQASYPMVYLNKARLGSIDSLREISASNITTIKFLSAGEATTLYGLNHASGAIMITIR